MSTHAINWAVYKSLPPAEAQYQLDHVHESRVRDIVSAHISCFTILAVAIILRFIARRMSKTSIKADDWMIVAALVSGKHIAVGLLENSATNIEKTYLGIRNWSNNISTSMYMQPSPDEREAQLNMMQAFSDSVEVVTPYYLLTLSHSRR